MAYKEETEKEKKSSRNMLIGLIVVIATGLLLLVAQMAGLIPAP